MNSIAHILCFVFALCVVVSATSCAPTMAGKIRENDPVTLGAWGAQYRPAKNLGLSFVSSSQTNDSLGTKNKSYAHGEDILDKKARREGRDLFYSVLWYPFESSAFFVGGGVMSRRVTTYFNEKTQSGDGEVSVRAEDSGIAMGVPVGFTWIWQSGATFHMDIGPHFYLSKTRRYTSGEDGSGVDESARDETMRWINSQHIYDNEKVRATNFILGFSF